MLLIINHNITRSFPTSLCAALGKLHMTIEVENLSTGPNFSEPISYWKWGFLSQQCLSSVRSIRREWSCSGKVYALGHRRG